ncbi:alpha/beta fold hydrolase [Dactylosporangium cerinum]
MAARHVLAALDRAVPRGRLRAGRAGLAGEPGTVAEAREHPEAVADHGIDDVVAHYAKVIAALPAKPILIGHSFGGMIAQKLLGQDLAAAAVAIDAAQIKGSCRCRCRRCARRCRCSRTRRTSTGRCR